MIQDWSQSGEQETILEWADRHGPGRFIDIGAADGSAASNTRALGECGWGGVAVEPAASYFAHLANLYADRTDVECVLAAVVTGAAPLVRFHLSDDLVSTTDEDHVEVWGEVTKFNPVHVGAVTVEQLLTTFPGPYDMASIDTEGSSLAIFADMCQLEAFAPGALVVVECEDGGERWTAQQHCLGGWHRLGVTPNNLLMEKVA